MFQQQPPRYHKVAQDSDSEDDEVILYAAATPLNDAGEDHTFGTGVYDRDLRLNLTFPGALPAKAAAKLREKRNMVYSALCFAAAVVILLGIAATVVVYAQVYISGNSGDKIDTMKPPIDMPNDSIPMCILSPSPLPGRANGCQGAKPTPPADTTEPVSTTPTAQQTEAVSTPSDVRGSTGQSSSITGQTSSSTTEPTSSTTGPAGQASMANGETTQPTSQTTRPTGQTSQLTGQTSQIETETKLPSQLSTTDSESPTSAEDKTDQLSDATPSKSETQSSTKTAVPAEQTSSAPDTSTLSQDASTAPTPSQSTSTTPTPSQDVFTTSTPSQSTSTSSTPSHINASIAASSIHSINWTMDYFPAASELSLQLLDMNKDGILDVITAKVSDPCVTELLALDGVSGEEVWHTQVNFPVISLRCFLDANVDDVIDCVASGRQGGFVALSGVDGSIIWVIDSSITFPEYNFYFPLLVDDLDYDGVPDLINTHGGDTVYPPSQHDRSPGMLVVVSGRTGGKLMEPILTPDGRETYCSPVLFKFGKTELVLFGTGGETVSGSLWAISLRSIKTKVINSRSKLVGYEIETEDTFHPCFTNNEFIENLRPTYNDSLFDKALADNNPQPYLKFCPRFGKRELVWNTYGVCLYEILHSPHKGVLLPPVILDLNADSVDDLLMSTFNQHVYACNGKDLGTMLWQEYYPGSESYSLPTPLFYSEDFFPDLLLRTNEGVWGEYYNSSTLHLVDGHNGRTLWSLDSSHLVMNSPLSLAADTHGHDAMLFFSIGRKEQTRERRHGDMQGAHHHIEPPPETDNLWISTSNDSFPDPDEDLDGFVQYCGYTMSEVSVGVYLVTRQMVEGGGKLVPIAVEKPFVIRGKVNMSEPDYTPPSHLPAKRQSDDQLSSRYPRDSMGEAPEDYPSNGDFDSDNFQPDNVKFDPQNGQFPPGFNPQNGQFPPGFDPQNGEFPPDFDPQNMDENSPPDHDMDFDPTDKKKVRCAHLLVPTDNVATPIIGDVNSDGKLELSYTVGWEVIEGSEQYLGQTPMKMRIRTFTLEDQFREVYSEGGLDFERLLPPDKQPWARYMGRTENNVYHPMHKARDQ